MHSPGSACTHPPIPAWHRAGMLCALQKGTLAQPRPFTPLQLLCWDTVCSAAEQTLLPPLARACSCIVWSWLEGLLWGTEFSRQGISFTQLGPGFLQGAMGSTKQTLPQVAFQIPEPPSSGENATAALWGVSLDSSKPCPRKPRVTGDVD